MNVRKMVYPWKREAVAELRSGDSVLLTGVIYMARDAAHEIMTSEFHSKGEFPFDIKDQGIYYAGPAPAKPGEVIGPAGPTTSGRMDRYTPLMLDEGLLLMIGKGDRNSEVTKAVMRNRCAYLAATGGTAALLSKCIKSQEIVAYEDLGPEALRKLYVEDFPAIVIIDCDGNNLYESGRKRYGSTTKTVRMDNAEKNTDEDSSGGDGRR